jgi:hypothetical protein
MPTTIKTFPADSIEQKAYASIDGIAFAEENDRLRLGYHVYLYLKKQIPTLDEAVHVALARMSVGEEQAVARIRARLQELGLEEGAAA